MTRLTYASTQVKGDRVAYSPEHYQANKESYATKSLTWRLNNPEKAKANRRRHYLENKEKSLTYSTEYNLKKKYNLTVDEYTTLLKAQKGVCAICGEECTRRLAVDHNHTTGKVRGLLCNNCNRGIGHLQDNSNLLKKAAEYIDHHSCL